MFVFVRIARVFFLIAFCCSTAFADMHPGQSYAAVEPNGDNASDAQSVPENKSGDLAVPPVALLAPDMLTHSKDTLPSAEPFDLPATIAPTG